MLGLDLDWARTTLIAAPTSRAFLHDDRLTSDPHRVGLCPHPSRNLLLSDGFVHRSLRAEVVAIIADRTRHGLRERLEARLEQCLGDLGRGRIELISGVIDPIVVEACAHLADIPPAAVEELSERLTATRGMLEPDAPSAPGAALAAWLMRSPLAGSSEVVERLVDRCRACDLPAAAGHVLTATLLHGAYENPLNYLGHLVLAAVTNRSSDLDQLKSNAFGERAPVRQVLRFAVEGLDEHDLAAGSPVWLSLLPASDGQPLMFGAGRHRCPGQSPATVMAEVILGGARDLWLDSELVDVDRHGGTVADGYRSITVQR